MPSRRTELFSYLPPLSDDQAARQVRYMLDRQLMPGIEYTARLDPSDDYWHFWKLPFFQVSDPAEVMAELKACRRDHPEAFIRLTGYDPQRQCQVVSFVLHRPDAPEPQEGSSCTS
ncbi:ribulose bisphosphate carboxylase small subunit [Limnochorda pilosa]|uniref:Ribulose bisphosphate carboxylase small subunit n=1 Tax=Limnochorda pilosa TaxID=1555112 RepID=A0A0K2SQ66_LIMPI|nr:ribulose bisphosphate carboxylase small subunit [Limnochorda pilosa]